MPTPALPVSSSKGDVPQHAEAAAEKESAADEISSGALKVLSVLYYMIASILVQSSNKARAPSRACTTARKPFRTRRYRPS